MCNSQKFLEDFWTSFYFEIQRKNDSISKIKLQDQFMVED